MQIGNGSLERDNRMTVAGDVAGAASPDTGAPGAVLHGGDDLRVPPHAEIIVGAPDGHRPAPALAVNRLRFRESLRIPLDFGECPVALLPVQRRDRTGKMRTIIHSALLKTLNGP